MPHIMTEHRPRPVIQRPLVYLYHIGFRRFRCLIVSAYVICAGFTHFGCIVDIARCITSQNSNPFCRTCLAINVDSTSRNPVFPGKVHGCIRVYLCCQVGRVGGGDELSGLAVIFYAAPFKILAISWLARIPVSGWKPDPRGVTLPAPLTVDLAVHAISICRNDLNRAALKWLVVAFGSKSGPRINAISNRKTKMAGRIAHLAPLLIHSAVYSKGIDAV